jgi:hypothetical protein
MSDHAQRLLVFDRETHLEGGSYQLGDTVEVVRGNGPREGERMGTGTVIDLLDDGVPVLDIVLGSDERDESAGQGTT